MPERGEADDGRLDKFVAAVDGIEALQLAAASAVAKAIRDKLQRGEVPTRDELKQLAEAKAMLCEGIAGLLDAAGGE